MWHYGGQQASHGLQDAGAAWLEEPFVRDDYISPLRLAAEMEMPITGGEGYVGLDGFRECVTHRTYDILQPEKSGCGGILTCVKVCALSQAFRLPCILHGTMSLRLAGWLQATLTIGSPCQELALVTPPLMPEELWSPGLKVLRSPQVFTIEAGMILAPEQPGLGLDVDEPAIERFRARG
jgi:D-galactarolactone cycloisomerase